MFMPDVHWGPDGFPKRRVACRKILVISLLGRAGLGDVCLQEGQSSGRGWSRATWGRSLPLPGSRQTLGLLRACFLLAVSS